MALPSSFDLLRSSSAPQEIGTIRPHVAIVSLSFSCHSERLTIPCLLVDGGILNAPTSWICSAARSGTSPASLERYAQALRRFCEYYMAFAQDQRGADLIRGFSAALDQGNTVLGWQPLSGRTADTYFNALNQFCDWLLLQPEFERFEHPNPLVLRPMTGSEREQREARSRQTSMLHHLFALTQSGQGLKRIRQVLHPHRRYRRHQHGLGDLNAPTAAPRGYRPKEMLLNDFWQLIEKEENPRNRLLWLLLGGAGARVSETLNMFATDVLFDRPSQEAIAIFANPVEGRVVLPDGREVMRRQYLHQVYHLEPRCFLPKKDPLHAGWKGMLEGGIQDHEKPDSDTWPDRRWVAGEWLMPVFGRLFWAAHLEYINRLKSVRPSHPYYFINLSHNIGEPLTRTNVTQLLAVACRRANIRERSPHCLRHMFGCCLADWGIPLPTAQLMMRHVSAASTLVYYRVSRAITRKRLMDAEKMVLNELQLSQLNQLQGITLGASPINSAPTVKERTG